MPTKWTPELDTILLRGVFEECNISFSKALCTRLAERIKSTGIDCTAKAVEGRLYNWKKKNVTSISTSTPASTPKPAVKPKRHAKATSKKMATPDSDEPEGLADESPSVRKKRQRAMPKKTVDYKESDGEDESGEEEEEEEEYVPLSKRVKTEPVEEEPMIFAEEVQGEMEHEVV